MMHAVGGHTEVQGEAAEIQGGKKKEVKDAQLIDQELTLRALRM